MITHNYTATLPSPSACIRRHTSYPMSPNPVSFPFPLSNLNIYNLYSVLFAPCFSANIIYGNEWTMSKRCSDACGIHGLFSFYVFYLFVLFLYLSTSPFSLLLTILCTLFSTLTRSHFPCVLLVYFSRPRRRLVTFSCILHLCS
jgi:hypothetical protein